ncbi:MAG: hypothetical protein ACRCUY_10340 [Thermoguttaceae bacterium]
MNTRCLYITCVPFVLLALFSGCGTRCPEGFPDVVPCQIEITKGGVPITDAAVIFAPFDLGGEWIVAGTTDALVMATIKTSQSFYLKAGAPVGKYRIAIQKKVDFEYVDSTKMSTNESSREIAKQKEENTRRRNAARIVPEIFESILLSPATVDISIKNSKYQIELDDFKTN